ncbi:MAG TPA: hypothetical protein V6D28_31270 [Leptolyngbyaceae cyanobacterium]
MGLDAVEMILGWEEAFGIQISDDEAFTLHTPKDAIDLISEKLGASEIAIGVCPTVRAYHSIRQAFQTVVGLQRKQILLNSKLRDIIPKSQRHNIWKKVFSYIGMPKSPSLSFGVGIIFSPISIRDLVDWSVARYPGHFISANERWTHSQVRSVVRATVRDVVGVINFKDEDDFIRNIGIS